ILELIPPPASGYGDGTAEPFDRKTTPTFDPIGAAQIAADIAISTLLVPERAARTIEQHGRDSSVPGFDEIVSALVRSTWSGPRAADGYGQAIQEAVQNLLIVRLMDLAANSAASSLVRAECADGPR